MKKFNQIKIFQANPYLYDNPNEYNHIEFVYKNNNSIMDFFRLTFDPNSYESRDNEKVIKRAYTLSEFLYYLGQTDFSDKNFSIQHFDEACLLCQDLHNPNAKTVYFEDKELKSKLDDLIVIASKTFTDRNLSKNKQREQEKIFRNLIRKKLKELNVDTLNLNNTQTTEQTM